jgi:hypothetical protein
MGYEIFTTEVTEVHRGKRRLYSPTRTVNACRTMIVGFHARVFWPLIDSSALHEGETPSGQPARCRRYIGNYHAVTALA